MQTSWADYLGLYVSQDDFDGSYCVRSRSGQVLDGGYGAAEEAEAARQSHADLERRQVEAGRLLPR